MTGIVKRIFTGAVPQADVKNEDEITEDEITKDEITVEVSSEQKADIRAEERSRIAEIIGCDEASGNRKSAEHLALNTTLSAEDAISVLAGIEPPVFNLDVKMESVDTDVGMDVEETPKPETETIAQRALNKIAASDKLLAARMKKGKI